MLRWRRRRHSVRRTTTARSKRGSQQWLSGAHRALSGGYASPFSLALREGTHRRLWTTGNPPCWGVEPRAWRPPRRRPRPDHLCSAGRLTARRPIFRPFLYPPGVSPVFAVMASLFAGVAATASSSPALLERLTLYQRASFLASGNVCSGICARLRSTVTTQVRPLWNSNSWVMFCAISLTFFPSPRRTLVLAP